MYDPASGDVCGMRARAIGDLKPKELAPCGQGANPLVMANSSARQMMRGVDPVQPIEGVIICEGVTDHWRISSIIGEAKRSFAVVGGVSGSFSSVGLMRIPNGAPIYIATDNDNAGDTYALKASEALSPRPVLRVQLPSGQDMDDALKDKPDRLWSMLEEAEMMPTPLKDGPVLVQLSDIECEEVSWLWEGYLAKGKITLLVGQPGLGKSFVSLDLAARVSRGSGWPDSSPGESGTVILMSAEDALGDTIAPRLRAMGGDPFRVHFLEAIREHGKERFPQIDRDLAALEAAIKAVRPALVIIDPLTAYLGQTDSHKEAEVRGLLAPVAKLVERHGVCLLAVMHLNKSTQQKALSRVGGSVAFAAVARSVCTVVQDPRDEDRRLFGSIKMNVSKRPASWGFVIDGTAGAPRVVWEAQPEPHLSVHEVIQGSSTGLNATGRGEEATEFLQVFLQDGPHPANVVFEAAGEEGISRTTLNRAKKALRISSDKTHEGWVWALAEPKITTLPS
jgi:archaellum biogenesis ATPase FlaH